ncbi:MAG: OmpA family protein [Edaphobacter sp.]|nr:OmpA family protein [Edaphobacter sp.]
MRLINLKTMRLIYLPALILLLAGIARAATPTKKFEAGKKAKVTGTIDRMNVEDSGRFALPFGSGGLLLGLQYAFYEEGDGAFALGGFAYFGTWGEDA